VIENFETGNGKGNALVVVSTAAAARSASSSSRRRRRHDAAISGISFGEFTARARGCNSFSAQRSSSLRGAHYFCEVNCQLTKRKIENIFYHNARIILVFFFLSTGDVFLVRVVAIVYAHFGHLIVDF
jgi:hypothetical protein